MKAMKIRPILTMLLVCSAVAGYTDNFGSIMAVGDSITGGTGEAGNSYRSFLDSSLSANGHSYNWVGFHNWGSFPSGESNRHSGMGGWDADQILNGNSSSPTAGKLSNWLSNDPTDTVLLMTPINGWWRWSGSYLTSQTTRDQAAAWNGEKLRGLLDTALSFNSGMTIFLASPTPETHADNVAAGFNVWAADTATLVQQLVVEYRANGANIKYVPIFENISQTPGVHHFDGVHWNNAGAQVGSDEFYEAMTTESVPEPTTLALLGAGLVAIARKRRVC